MRRKVEILPELNWSEILKIDQEEQPKAPPIYGYFHRWFKEEVQEPTGQSYILGTEQTITSYRTVVKVRALVEKETGHVCSLPLDAIRFLSQEEIAQTRNPAHLLGKGSRQ